MDLTPSEFNVLVAANIYGKDYVSRLNALDNLVKDDPNVSANAKADLRKALEEAGRSYSDLSEFTKGVGVEL